MKRIHALEWEDLTWFPSSWRDFGTDYLRFISSKFNIYKPIIPFISKGMERSGKNEWVDCASGGGGGLVNLAEDLKKEKTGLKIILTDFYPNQKSFERTKAEIPEVFEYEVTSVDAMNLPPHLHRKFRTMFASFHHFRPNDARKILQNAVDSGSNIAIFEPVGKSVSSWLSMLFVPLNVLILAPFIRPVRWLVLPFIYLIPIIPLYIWWDGIASILRTYSAKELQSLVDSLKNGENYDWEIGQTKGSMPIYYLVGNKK